MNGNNIKFAVVGCGNIGKRHLAVINAQSRASIGAFCDIDESACASLTGLYPNTPWFKDYDAMLDLGCFDVVSICTPHGLHSSMAIQAMNRGKHALVEKPMALTTKDAMEMIRTADENGVHLMIVKQNRFNVPIALTKKALDSGKLGRIFMVQCLVLWNREDEYYSSTKWRGRISLEGGSLYTQVSHFLDLMIWWFGDVISAKADIQTKNHKIEIEDCGSAIMQFASGVSGSLTWTTCVYNKNFEGSITIIGENGTIKIGGQYLNKIDYWDVKAFPFPEDVAFVDQPNSYGKYQGSSSNHDKVIDSVVAELLMERHNVVEGNEGIKTIEAIEMIYDSARNK